ncbi:O-antigen polymerase [Blautia massiliensis (ex Durand et al. 2017)]|uniref:O-antigen polymerase n=1 Tax=Blautia massiliensis (ex Durand et al. 2017) TaxID=1737424 RepID=UPI003992C54F
MLQIFIATMVMYHLLYHKQNGWNKHYNIKALVKIVVIATVLLIIFVELRDIVGRNYSETAKSPLYYICCYIGGSIHLLDDFIKKPIDGSQIWGKETFYSIIRFIGQRFNIKDWIYISHLEFRYSNGLNVGNIYTAFRKYIYDFGYFGVIWCTALVSFIYNQIYYTIKYSKKEVYCMIFLLYFWIYCLWIFLYVYTGATTICHSLYNYYYYAYIIYVGCLLFEIKS